MYHAIFNIVNINGIIVLMCISCIVQLPIFTSLANIIFQKYFRFFFFNLQYITFYKDLHNLVSNMLFNSLSLSLKKFMSKDGEKYNLKTFYLFVLHYLKLSKTNRYQLQVLTQTFLFIHVPRIYN